MLHAADRKRCLQAAFLATAGTLSLVFSTGVSAKSPREFNRITMGTFASTATGKERGFDISGRAMLVRFGTRSQAFTQVLGLDPNTDYPSHVHNLPCDVNGGGGHYKIDPNVEATQEANEIWPFVATNADAIGLGFAEVDHVARPEGQSIVVHDPVDGVRLACADLHPDNDGALLAEGRLHGFASAAELGFGAIEGLVQMVRSHGRTFVTVKAYGLSPETEYPAHVHALPCELNNGGAHYKMDPNEETTLEANEIWPLVSTNAEGMGTGMADVAHWARPEAQSVVIHHSNGSRIACADLELPRAWFLTRGSVLTTAGGIERGYDLAGSTTLVRKTDGHTKVRLAVAGLQANTRYPAHVHNLPCRLGGGGHYKIDPTVEETLRANEIWIILYTNHSGRARRNVEVRHLARPEAQSVVIHDPTDGVRIGCFDLD